MTLLREIDLLLPALEVILSCGSSQKCARLLEQLEDNLLGIFCRWLRRFISRSGAFKLETDQETHIRRHLLPYKKELNYLGSKDIPISKKRKRLSNALKSSLSFHRVLSSLARTLQEIAEKNRQAVRKPKEAS